MSVGEYRIQGVRRRLPEETPARRTASHIPQRADRVFDLVGWRGGEGGAGAKARKGGVFPIGKLVGKAKLISLRHFDLMPVLWQVETLLFSGKNVVVFSKPKCTVTAASTRV